MRSIASEVGTSFGANQHLRYVKGFSKIGAENVNQ